MQTHESIRLKDMFRPPYVISLLSAFALLTGAYLAEYFANSYALLYLARETTKSVGDLILDGVPTYDLSFFLVEIAFISIAWGIFYVLYKPRYLLFSLKAVALFIIIRAFFISLTHVGIHPDGISPGLGFFDAIYQYLHFQTGFFFSGHTGLPFLMALVLWQNQRIRYSLIALSLALGAASLVAHVHYSIDVFAAPFMAYGIYRIAIFLFPRDYALTTSAYLPRP